MALSETKNELITKYFNMVYKLALSRTKHKSNAEDVTQEVFLRFFEKDISFESEEHIKAWLIRVTINCSTNIFTNSYFKKTVPLDEDLKTEMKEKSEVYYAVSELPLKYRTVIHLFYYEDMKISQIASVLGEKESTIKSQLHRARNMLEIKLKGEYDFV